MFEKDLPSVILCQLGIPTLCMLIPSQFGLWLCLTLPPLHPHYLFFFIQYFVHISTEWPLKIQTILSKPNYNLISDTLSIV